MPKIFCSVDTVSVERAMDLARMMAGTGAGIKLGLEFFNANGPGSIARIRDTFPDLPFFLDLKLHDIPNTVAASVRALVRLQPDYLNVHASGGYDMMRAANDAAHDAAARDGLRPAKMIAVTVLTSFDEAGFKKTGHQDPIERQVLRLAALTKEADLAGVVCSPHEIRTIREKIGNEFVLITPGIRPEGADVNDQKRVMTPKEAMHLGATHLVIGRPITGADDPGAAVAAILSSL